MTNCHSHANCRHTMSLNISSPLIRIRTSNNNISSWMIAYIKES
uniref:Uncharacterized protein n=1 Tax=Arundo donax TaxID=35708 RepID=A0A0A9BES0_ARUDO